MTVVRGGGQLDDESMSLEVAIDRAEGITLEDAIAQAQDIEDALLETANMADRDVLKYVLDCLHVSAR